MVTAMAKPWTYVAVAVGIAFALLALVFLFGGWGAGGMGGMMGGGMGVGMGLGLVLLIVLVVAVTLATASIARPGSTPMESPNPTASAPVPPPAMAPPAGAPAVSVPAPTAVAGTAGEKDVVLALPEDLRLLYVRIRETGGTVLQSDIVRWGTFSKPKVTRLLDRLEARGLAVRERHGMTNRVRLTPPRAP